MTDILFIVMFNNKNLNFAVNERQPNFFGMGDELLFPLIGRQPQTFHMTDDLIVL